MDEQKTEVDDVEVVERIIPKKELKPGEYIEAVGRRKAAADLYVI